MFINPTFLHIPQVERVQRAFTLDEVDERLLPEDYTDYLIRNAVLRCSFIALLAIRLRLFVL